MIDWIWEKAILDADFAIKLEKVQKFKAIEKYIPQLVNKPEFRKYRFLKI